jgi:peptidoglycan-associated lipoprotein
VKITRTLLMAFAVVALISSGLYGCKGAQQAKEEGVKTTQPAGEGATTGQETGTSEQKELPPGPKEQPEPVEPVRPELALKDVHFDLDSFAIKPSETGILEDDAKWMKDNPSAVITVEGHCDERGTVEYNLSLGERRANAAKDYLVTLGVDASRLKTISYGKSKPIDTGHDEAAWAKNRRAHFVVQ